MPKCRLVSIVDSISGDMNCVMLTWRMWPSLHAISPLEGSLCHCLEPQVGHRRRGAIADKWNQTELHHDDRHCDIV